MNDFISKFEKQIVGTLSGYDRLVLTGHLPLSHERGMRGYLRACGLGLKEFGTHAETMSKEVKEASLASVLQQHRPVEYLRSPKEDKQARARAIAVRDGISSGVICAFKSVELSRSYNIRKDANAKKLVLEPRLRPGTVVYRYEIHPVFGLMAVRLQTWFPFQMMVLLNGREWLAQQMQQEGVGYRKYKNCFAWVDDFPRAQALMDQQMKVNWQELLSGIREQVNPLFPKLCRNYPMEYYWCCSESEWAMDIVFREGDQLRRLYPQLVQLGITSFSSTDVLRFFGKSATRGGGALGRYDIDINTDLKVRASGVRLKHRHGSNSIKIYDKVYEQGGTAALRFEVTVNRCEIFRVYRTKMNDPEGEKSWRTMRRSIVDLTRRAEASQKALDVYSSALAAVDDSTTLEELVARVERRIKQNNRSYRALHPFAGEDLALMKAIHRGEFAIHGFRNRDLQSQLYATPPKTDRERKSRSAVVSRKLKLLRVHGLIRKLPHTHRYRVTDAGAKILNAILSAQRFTVQQILLNQAA